MTDKDYRQDSSGGADNRVPPQTPAAPTNGGGAGNVAPDREAQKAVQRAVETHKRQVTANRPASAMQTPGFRNLPNNPNQPPQMDNGLNDPNKPAEVTPMSYEQQPVRQPAQQIDGSDVFKADYTTPDGQTSSGYLKDGRTYTDAGLTNEVAPGTVVTDSQGRDWTKPGGAYETTYVDANGNTQKGYIINGTTYTDPEGKNPIGYGSIVTDQSGRKWIKTPHGSVLYSEYTSSGEPDEPGFDKSEGVEYSNDLKNLLAAWKDAAEKGAVGQIDYATQQAITELERALEDAQPKFKTQQDQITADEMNAKDNAALYAELRGDKGGIGLEQYNAIANNAATNRQTVASEQTKLSTDTARQIADLRAQGEFEKADKMLEIAQTYLSQLISIEQWGMEFGLSVDQFNEAIRQWELEFQNALKQQGFENDLTLEQWEWQQGQQDFENDLALKQWEEQLKQQGIQNAFTEAGLTGIYNGELTLQGKNQIADVAAGLLEMGITLTDEQIKSLGMTDEQVAQYKALVEAAKTPAGSGTGGGPGPEDELEEEEQSLLQYMVSTFKNREDAIAYLATQDISQWQYNALLQAYDAATVRGSSGSGYEGVVWDLVAVTEDTTLSAKERSDYILNVIAVAKAQGKITPEEAEQLRGAYWKPIGR